MQMEGEVEPCQDQKQAPLSTFEQWISSKNWSVVPQSFFKRNAAEVAPELIGKLICVSTGGSATKTVSVKQTEILRKKRGREETENTVADVQTSVDLESNSWMVARIVEVEAYRQTDPASHSFKGQTPRTAVLFGPAGFAYVYSIHARENVNFVCEPEGSAGGVLIRAVAPVWGEDHMRSLRPKTKTPFDLTNGPSKLCDALGISKAHYGTSLQGPHIYVLAEKNYSVPPNDVVATTRIGIKVAQDVPWRFVMGSSPYLSCSLNSKAKNRPRVVERAS